MKQKFICKPGSRSYNRRSLHHIGNSLNPYEQAISIVGKTLSAFDEDNLIPCFGFGDGRSNAPSMIQCINNLIFFADVFPFFWQHQRMTKMSSASSPTINLVTDLKKFYIDIKKLSLF